MSDTIHVPATGEAIKSDYGLDFGTGPTVPSDGVIGWQHGAIWTKALGTTALDAMYVNTGSPASCAFVSLTALATTVTGTQTFSIPLDNWKVWDAPLTPLGLTALSADDLIFTPGTYGTSAPTLKGSDVGGSGGVTQYARKIVPVPDRYVPGGAISLVVKAGMQTLADTAATLTANVYRAAAPTVDLFGTPADIDSLTLSNITMALTATNLVPGDLLDIRLGTTVTDNGDAGANINAIISEVHLAALCYL
jgi:hypothetical protein